MSIAEQRVEQIRDLPKKRADNERLSTDSSFSLPLLANGGGYFIYNYENKTFYKVILAMIQFQSFLVCALEKDDGLKYCYFLPIEKEDWDMYREERDRMAECSEFGSRYNSNKFLKSIL